MQNEAKELEPNDAVSGRVDLLVSCGFCEGEIETRAVENCSCHISPPCSACTEPRNFCPECGWEEADEPIEEPKYTCKPYESPKPSPMDNTKIDWRYKPHTHFTMIKYGVYPEGTTMAEVKKEVDGTFGGRFNYFGGGKFEFIAYTD
ncbi:MAG: hypothetical protein OEM38_09255 [Gammaproteobacteria bacterium]|nr:hypothetical protein [Gammaproteobacteria bacterium]